MALPPSRAARRAPRAEEGGTLVGFHEKRSSYVADMDSCEVLPERYSRMLRPLRDLVDALSIRSRLPQVEIAAGDEADVLVLRVLEPPTVPDLEHLRDFSGRHGVRIYLQPGGPDTASPLSAEDAANLYYELPEFDLRMHFGPTDFTQVNHAVNRVLVRRALALLDPQPGERIADMFCGIGNFTLAIARRGAIAVGFEGSAELLRRAAANAGENGLADSALFVEMDLYAPGGVNLEALGQFDRMLIDPPRDGAVGWSKHYRTRPTANRLRLLQPGNARARCGRAHPGARLSALRRGGGQHVPAHVSHRVHSSLRPRRGVTNRKRPGGPGHLLES
jgi:23S rRNA (uracil1939-C5)-methyltransferase